MKKLLSILLMLVLVASIFTACGGDKKDGGDQNPSTLPADGGNDADANTDGDNDAEGDANDAEAAALKDDTYTAEEADFAEKSGWKDNVTIEVKDGKIASVDWNSTHKDGGKDKKTSSKDGDYGMVEKGGASAEWHEQAEKVEAFLVEKQDVDAITLNDDGSTDAIAGVTITVSGFVDMVKDALSGAK